MTSSISSSERRTNPRRVLGFVVVAVAVVLIAGEVFARFAWLNPNTPKIQEMLALEGETNDVLYIGDSTTLDGVNPAVVESELGLRGYNLASGGQSLVESELVLRHYLARNRKPRAIMLGLFVNRNPEPQINPDIYFGLSSDERELLRDRTRDTGAITWSYRLFNTFKLYRYRGIISYMLDRLNKQLTGESRSGTLIRGHLALDYSKVEKPPSGLRFAELDEKALDSVLALCATEGIPVLMFEPPNTPGFSALTANRGQLLTSIRARTNARVTFQSFDGDAALPYAKDEWSGRNHLNRKGAVRFTKEQLVPYLQHRLDRQGMLGTDEGGRL